MVCMGGNGMQASPSCAKNDPLTIFLRLFIIEGVVTIGVAIICIFLLPDEPLTTRWLSPAEQQLAHDRMQRDTVGLEPSKGVRAGLMQAIRDPRLYLFIFMQNMHLSATSFNQVSFAVPSLITVLTLECSFFPQSSLRLVSAELSRSCLRRRLPSSQVWWALLLVFRPANSTTEPGISRL